MNKQNTTTAAKPTTKGGLTADTEKAAVAILATLSQVAEKEVLAIVSSYGRIQAAVNEAVSALRKLGIPDAEIAPRVRSALSAIKAGTVNAAMRKAGLRQRGFRCDMGVEKAGKGFVLVGGVSIPLEAGKAKAKAKADDEDDTSEEDAFVDRTAKRALAIYGDKAAALKAWDRVRKAIMALED